MKGINYLSRAEAEVYEWRDRLSNEIRNMTPQEEVSYLSDHTREILREKGMEYLLSEPFQEREILSVHA